MNGPSLTRSDGVAWIDLRDHELDAAEATSLLDVLALPDLERVVIEIHDRGSLGASANVLLRGLERISVSTESRSRSARSRRVRATRFCRSTSSSDRWRRADTNRRPPRSQRGALDDPRVEARLGGRKERSVLHGRTCRDIGVR